MTDDELATQLFKAVQAAVYRARKDGPKTTNDWERQTAIAYMSGMSQCLDFLIRTDGGEFTPQRLQQANRRVGEHFGFNFGPPEPPKG